jgi:hypothetical protein
MLWEEGAWATVPDGADAGLPAHDPEVVGGCAGGSYGTSTPSTYRYSPADQMKPSPFSPRYYDVSVPIYTEELAVPQAGSGSVAALVSAEMTAIATRLDRIARELAYVSATKRMFYHIDWFE